MLGIIENEILCRMIYVRAEQNELEPSASRAPYLRTIGNYKTRQKVYKTKFLKSLNIQAINIEQVSPQIK